ATLLVGLSLAAVSGSAGRASAFFINATAPTEKTAGPQHWCSTNGVTCADPNLNWDEYPGYQQLLNQGVQLAPYIGHDEPEVQFFSNRAGSANDVTYQLRLPKDPPTRPEQDGSGGNWNFQQR